MIAPMNVLTCRVWFKIGSSFLFLITRLLLFIVSCIRECGISSSDGSTPDHALTSCCARARTPHDAKRAKSVVHPGKRRAPHDRGAVYERRTPDDRRTPNDRRAGDTRVPVDDRHSIVLRVI